MIAVTHVNLMLRWMVSGDCSTEPEESNSLIKSCATQEFAIDISPADTGWRAALPRGSGIAPAPQSLAGAERRLGLVVIGAMLRIRADGGEHCNVANLESYKSQIWFRVCGLFIMTGEVTTKLQRIRSNPSAVSAEDQVRLASNFRNRKFAFLASKFRK